MNKSVIKLIVEASGDVISIIDSNIYGKHTSRIENEIFDEVLRNMVTLYPDSDGVYYGETVEYHIDLDTKTVYVYKTTISEYREELHLYDSDTNTFIEDIPANCYAELLETDSDYWNKVNIPIYEDNVSSPPLPYYETYTKDEDEIPDLQADYYRKKEEPGENCHINMTENELEKLYEILDKYCFNIK